MTEDELRSAFAGSASDEQILAARYDVLEVGTASLSHIGKLLQSNGWVLQDKRQLAAALLANIAAELVAGITISARHSLAYASGALLRQLIEVEYLMFLGYQDPANLERWYTAQPKDLREDFKPHKMRKMSGGLFQDKEYRVHCEVGGHPHPKARILLSSYASNMAPLASLLPDAVQHLRRLWTSIRLTLPKLDARDEGYAKPLESMNHAIEHWLETENPIVVSFDGIPRT